VIKLLKIEDNSMFILRDDKQVKTTLNIPDLGFSTSLNFNNGELYIDGVLISDAAIKSTIESYIDSFSFPSNAVHGLENCIDSNLNYVGFVDTASGVYTQVSVVPSLSMTQPFWKDTLFIEGCLINKSTKKYQGIGPADGIETEFAPVADLPTELDPFLYSYNDDSWSVSLDEAKVFYKIKTEDEIYYTGDSITGEELASLNSKKDAIDSATSLDELVGVI